ncbi:MAG TPA: Xaa-Pro peptidase family protein, partial [Anaerolineae bacterium]|nr:Xaa-Pro peptidase family protein [Anaerolineae bacterium]
RYALLTNAFWDHPEERTWAEVVITSDFGARLTALLPDSARRVGIAGYRCFPTPVYRALQTALPGTAFEDATPLLLEAARVKSAAEIAVMRRSMVMTDAAGRAFLATVGEGANEREIQAEVERALLGAGADRPAFSVQLYSGAQVAVGVGFRRDRTVARGEQVQVDCGALYRGYQTELSRVTTVGRPTDGARAIMEATAQMYEAMLRTVGPGVPVAEVARVAIATAKAQGMEPYLYRSPNHAGNFVGHGIGCWYHESPEIHPDAKGTLEANMVIVLEPILGHPGVGGAKIEDPVLVTPYGAERLSGLEIRTWPA